METVFIIIAAVLVGMWLFGLVTRTLGKLIHIFLILAAAAAVYAIVVH